jgi:hypothetical protein
VSSFKRGEWRCEGAIWLVAAIQLGYNVCAASDDAHNVSRGRLFMAEKNKEKRGVTRRQFMKAVPIGIVGALAVSVISGRLASSLFRRNKPQLPDDSIFAPSKDKYNRT